MRPKHLPVNAHLSHLKKQAKDHLQELRISNQDACLHDAQLALARQYGFASWPRLSNAVKARGHKATAAPAAAGDRSAALTSALQELRRGRPVILFDDEGRENEGDFVVAAEHACAETVNFITKHGRGTLCLSMTPELVDRLKLPLMTGEPQHGLEPAFTVSIDAAAGVTTGVSAADRAATIRAAVAEGAGPKSVRSPGHVFPLRAVEGGVRARQGHTEGSVELMRLAGLRPAAMICEILNDDGTMARWPDLEAVARLLATPLLRMSELLGGSA